MIRKAELADLPVLTDLALQLWPDYERAALMSEMKEILAKEDAVFFLSEVNGKQLGFAQCQLRHDYVEGTESSPVGYLEGIFVEEEARGSGIAKKLLAACESWVREQGCREFASDCELTNAGSLSFHLAMGFQEANRIICFTKKL
ncbi:MAG: GNAT family N-acetyltransferase [Oscillospiraceae bacterium]|nr:GNAT family N-acetyltransferase [Oscillospiraceae bacterium]